MLIDTLAARRLHLPGWRAICGMTGCPYAAQRTGRSSLRSAADWPVAHVVPVTMLERYLSLAVLLRSGATAFHYAV